MLQCKLYREFNVLLSRVRRNNFYQQTRWPKFVLIFSLMAFGINSKVFADSTVSTVQFEVDMRSMQHLTAISDLDVAIRGSAAPLDWEQSRVFLKDEDNDGVYTTTIDFKLKDKRQLEFRFVVAGGRIWEQRDNHKMSLVANQTKIYRAVFEHPERSQNPFKKYLGQWEFDQQGFSIVWDGAPVATNKDMSQITDCAVVNHDRSILCLISDSQDPFSRGHILWTYDSTNRNVHWLSHFFPNRNGVGVGTIDNDGNLTAKVQFENEPEGSYRIYQWRWLNNNSYIMMSRQFNADDQPTGDWYGGTSIRAN